MIKKDNVRNVLISRTDRLGDVILTLPLVSFADLIFRDAQISFLVNESVVDLIQDYNGIDEIIPEENVQGFFDKLKFFRSKKPDVVINVKPRFDLALIFFLLRVKYRVGTAYRWYSFLYNEKVYEHRKFADKHESEYNLNLLRTFFKNEAAKIGFHLNYTQDEFDKLNLKLQHTGFDIQSNYIIIHPGSRGSARDISMDRLSEFSELFLGQYDFKLVFTGLKEEKKLIEPALKSLDEKFPNRVFDLSGLLNLRELMIVIDKSELFISNSTGPVHIAGALNKKVIGFYPTEKPMNKERWRPLTKYSVILEPPIQGDMNSISADEILKSADKLIGNEV